MSPEHERARSVLEYLESRRQAMVDRLVNQSVQ